MTVDGIDISISNPKKVLFPETGATKSDLASYYQDVAPLMIPLVEGRPLTLARFPSGAGMEEFYQKEAQSYFPEYINRVEVTIEEGRRTYISADNASTLVYLANLVSVPHIWISRRPDVRCADLVVWDLDPAPGITFDNLRTGARLLRHLLEEMGVKPYLKLTGSRGLHISAVLEEPRPVDTVFNFGRDTARFIAQSLPEAFTIEFAKNRRGTRIYVDYLRNRYAQSFAAPYAVRSVSTASIAMPISWDELDSDIDARSITISNVREHISRHRDFLESWQRAVFDFEGARSRLDSFLST